MLFFDPVKGEAEGEENGFRFCSPASAVPEGVNEHLRNTRQPRRRVSPRVQPSKTDHKGMFKPSLLPSTWTKLVGSKSKLFASKNKEAVAGVNRPANPTPGPVARAPSHHRRSKSEPIELTEEPSLLQAELLELALKYNTDGKVPIQEGAYRVVGEVVQNSPEIGGYAHSVELELDCVDSEGAEETASVIVHPISSEASEDDKERRKEREVEGSSRSKDSANTINKLGTSEANTANTHAEQPSNTAGKSLKHMQSRAGSVCDRESPAKKKSPALTDVQPDEMQGSRDHWSTVTQPSTRRRVHKAKSANMADTYALDMPRETLADSANYGVWGITQSNLVNGHLPPQKSQLLNCSASHGQKNWRLTDSSLKAYNAMRGTYQGAGRDLFAWLDRCSKSFDKPEECNERVGSAASVMVGLEPLQYDVGRLYEPSKKEVFVVPRPPYEHISPPPKFAATDHREPSIEVPTEMVESLRQDHLRDKGFAKDDGLPKLPSKCVSLPELASPKVSSEEFCISDNEGDPQEGRISPCTFRLWAEGCGDRKSNNNNTRTEKSVAMDEVEKRCITHDEIVRQLQDQTLRMRAMNLGSATETPCPSEEYPMLGQNPYGIWNPRGVELYTRVVYWQQGLFTHLAKSDTEKSDAEESPSSNDCKFALREVTADPADVVAAGTLLQDFTQDEVASALNAKDARELAGVPPNEVGNFLNTRYEALNQCQLAELQATSAIQDAEARISWLQAQQERVNAWVQSIVEMREQQKKKRRRRHEEIYRHVSKHLKDVELECAAKHQQAWALTVQLTRLLRQEAEMVETMREQARRVGVDLSGDEDLRHVEMELQRLVENGGEQLERQQEEDDDDGDDCSIF